MEEVRSNSGQNLGIAALITGIITFVLAVIPCIGVIAIIPGIVAVVLAAIGLSQASKSNAPRGVIIAGLVIGVVALMISFSQIFVAGKLAGNADKWPGDIKSIIDEVKDDVIKDLEKSDINIRIESNGDTVEINTRIVNEDKIKQLEELESGNDVVNDTLEKK
jgi:hypothetical protein